MAGRKNEIRKDRERDMGNSLTKVDSLKAIMRRRQQIVDEDIINNIEMIELTDDLILPDKKNYLAPKNDEEDLIIGFVKDRYGVSATSGGGKPG